MKSAKLLQIRSPNLQNISVISSKLYNLIGFLSFISGFWTTPPDVSDEDSIAAVRISHIWLFWNRDLVQRYAFPDSSDIFRCFARQEHDCSSAVHPLPHCIIQLTHIQKVVTKEQGLQLQIYIVIGLLWLLIDKFLTTANAYTSSQLL